MGIKTGLLVGYQHNNCRCLKIERAQKNIRKWKKNKWEADRQCIKNVSRKPLGSPKACDERYLQSRAEGC
jgi:hypothetical protein